MVNNINLSINIPPVGGSLTTTMGSFTFTASSPVIWGRIKAYDIPYFLDPGYAVTITWTPAPTTASALEVNRGMKNPDRGFQGWDARATDYYSAPLMASSVIMRSNDSLIVAKHNPNQNSADGGTATHPVYTLEYGGLLCLASVPLANASIPLVGPYANGGTARPVDVLDETTITFPGYSIVEAITNIDTLITAKAKFNPAVSVVSAVEGKRQLTVSGLTNEDGYGEKVVGVASNVGIRLIGNDLLAKRQTLAKHVWANARQNYHAVKASGAKWFADGAQNQGEAMDQILAAGWMGNTAELATMHTDIVTNELAQSVRIVDAPLLAKIRSPHSTVANDYGRINLRKTVSGVAGNVLTFATATNPSEFSPEYTGVEIVRESDGATAYVTAYDGVAKTITIDTQPGSPFVQNDVLYCRAPWPQAVGDVEWWVKGIVGAYYYGPSVGDSYFVLNNWSGEVLAVQAFGFIHNAWNQFRDYVVRANLPNVPSSTYNFPDHHSSAAVGSFWDRMWPTISTVPQTVG